MSAVTTLLRHRRARMDGRDPDESHRTATPLELLFDLTFVVAFGIAADELAHYVVDDHIKAGLFGFALATFAIIWAWINFSWFASAYDTDDWVYRLTTMVQMVGVIILALGLPAMFASIDEGETLDNRVMVAGYVVMRLAMVFQWGRAARQDPPRRPACMTYVVAILVAQAGWVVLLVAETTLAVTLVCVVALVLVEFAGPWIAETRKGGTPWHPHHIAERYGLLVIIALGEGVIGTIASLSALVGPEGTGWTVDAALVCIAGVGLTFGMWWIYFVIPCAQVLEVHRERSFSWGYGQILLIGAVVGTGAGLHIAAYFLEEESEARRGCDRAQRRHPGRRLHPQRVRHVRVLTRSFDGFHVILVAISAVFLAAPLVLAAAGASMAWCLVVLALSPWVTVVGYELRGHAHNARVLERLQSAAETRT